MVLLRAGHVRSRPARKRAGYPHEGRLRGLLEPAQAGLVLGSPPVHGPGHQRENDFAHAQFCGVSQKFCNSSAFVLPIGPRLIYHEPMCKKLRVLLMQLPVPNNPALNTPLALGYLKAYAAAQGLLEIAEIDVLPRVLADHGGDAALVEAIVARQPDLLGISLYTWNSERSLAVALRVKQRLSALTVLVGGPEVQPDNDWVLNHPAVDIAAVGEGERTFAELIAALAMNGGRWSVVGGRWSVDHRQWMITADAPPSTVDRLLSIPGLIFRDGEALVASAARAAISDLGEVPSPYLAGYLELPADGMLMVEISRWCPYACSFCLYGRNMGPKLGGRYFDLDRVLATIAWGKAQGVQRVHFVEANLNLVPIFWPLMRALAQLNADKQLTFYAELRGEHLTDAVVAALAAANVLYVEVGLQTANPVALRASQRRTDLAKWAAGTRRLYAQGIEVYLDVILGLPADDAAGVAATLDFITREELGTYDIFTLQVLPGTGVRSEAAQYGMVYQDRPPYYVLGSAQLSYAELRRLRRELKQGAGLDPAAIEGMPAPRSTALMSLQLVADYAESTRIDTDQQLNAAGCANLQSTICNLQSRLIWGEPIAKERLAAHVDLILPIAKLVEATPALAAAIEANPSTIFDLYLLCAGPPPPADELAAWREMLPYLPGYLDRVAVYSGLTPAPGHRRVSPRLFLVLPWSVAVEPCDYADTAAIIWEFALAPSEDPPLQSWAAAGGAGIWLRGDLDPAIVAEWQAATGRLIWQ